VKLLLATGQVDRIEALELAWALGRTSIVEILEKAEDGEPWSI
jgi:hypothetical protein